MQAQCSLIIDSCCDLPAEIVKCDGVYLLEFPYVMSDGEHSDDLYQSTSAHEFFEAMRHGEEPTTAQLSVPAIRAAFDWALARGLPTVYLSFSSGLSGSYDVSMLVKSQYAEEHPDFELHVVDTKLASVAEALLVYEAIRQWEKGMSAEELVRWAEEARNFVGAQFMVDDLEALRRGGRIPSTVALAGAKLDVKPLLGITAEGKLSLSGVARGRKKGIKQLADYYEKYAADRGSGSCVIIGSADCPKDVSRLRELLMKNDESLLVLECSIGPVIGSHVGPGMIAIVFWGSDRREDVSVADRIARKIKSS